MPIISTYCKKGGVGKTTFLGYLAHYVSQQNKSVLVISADDQNSIFKIFGAEKFISERDDNYLEHLLAGQCKPDDIVCEARPGMYLCKTLNTDRLSLTLTLRMPEERKFRAMIQDFTKYFDYIFVDFPPSSSRVTEILLDISDIILLVVGLDTLGLDGYFNTIQYFIDSDLNLDKIKYIVPTGYHPIKIAPNNCLKELKKQVVEYTPKAKLLTPISDKSIIRNLQSEGVSVFDDHPINDPFHRKNRDAIKNELKTAFDGLDLQ